MRKVYVCVNADYTTEGKILPRWFVWEDGRRFSVDRILDVQRAASRKAGGFGLCYTVRVLGKETSIWFDDYEQKWFMEGR